ncbi:MAG: uracil-DNA glycosylase, partial [Bacteroidota bacterium]
FVIAATNEILEKEPQAVIRVLRTIHDANDRFMENESAIQMVSERYQQQLKDVERWFHSTEWATHGWVSDKMLKSVVYGLRSAGIVEQEQVIPELIWRRES